MKKMILVLAVMVVFLAVGKAKAEEAWILWEYEQMYEKSVRTINEWKIVGAYPMHTSCIQNEKTICDRYFQLWRKGIGEGCFESWGGHSFHYSSDAKDTIILWEWKCLPDTIDPRK